MNNKKRILFLDYARVFTAFLVVYGHLYPFSSSVRLYIYAFHMPLFFLISGFLHSPRKSVEELKKYIRTIAIPTLFFILIGVLVHHLYFHKNILYLLYSIYKGVVISGDIIPVNAVLWFLFALFGCKFLMYIYLRYIEGKKILLLICFLLFIVILFLCRKTSYPFFFRNSVMAFPFYFIGFYAKQLYSKKYYIISSRLTCFSLAFLFALICIMITRINGRVSMFDYNFGKLIFPLNAFLFYINGIMGSLMIFCLSLILRKDNKLIRVLAESLISILGFQEPILSIIKYHGEDHNYFISAFVAIFVTICCVVLNQVVVSICPQLLGKMKSEVLLALFFLTTTTSCEKEEIDDSYNKDTDYEIINNRKSYSILGNSISTFQDYIPNGFKTYYPKLWFRDVHET